MEESSNALKVLCAEPEARDHFEDLGIDGTNYNIKMDLKRDWNVLAGFIWLRIGFSGGLF
jgi:hypothetical protein